MLADPTIPVDAVANAQWGRRARRTRVGVRAKVVAAHDSFEAGPVVTQEKLHEDFVALAAVPIQSSASAVAALVVVIVHEGDGVINAHKVIVEISKANVNAAIYTATVHHILERLARLELGDSAHIGCRVLAGRDGLAALIDDLVVKKGSAAIGWRKIIELPHNGLNVSRPHVLGGIHPEALDSNGNQVIDIGRDGIPDFFTAALEVIETHQVAISDIIGIAVVINHTIGVEVIFIIGDGRIPLIVFIRVVVGAGGSLANARVFAGHVVDDQVHNDVDSDGVAALHHVDKLISIAAAGGEDVGNGLVTFPPLGALTMLLRRRHLNPAIAERGEVILALRGDPVPLPFEEVHDDVAIVATLLTPLQ